MTKINKLGLKETIKRIIPLFILSFTYIIVSTIKYYDYITLDKIGNILLESVGAGLIEELIFRKLILGSFLKKRGEQKYMQSIIITAVLFGAIHLINLTSPEYNTLSVIIQVLSASTAGIMFGLMYFHSKSYWLCAITHTIYDIGAFMTAIKLGNQQLDVSGIPSELITIVLIGLICLSLFTKNKKAIKPIGLACSILIVILALMI